VTDSREEEKQGGPRPEPGEQRGEALRGQKDRIPGSKGGPRRK
jgi:hypothetical protein